LNIPETDPLLTEIMVFIETDRYAVEETPEILTWYTSLLYDGETKVVFRKSLCSIRIIIQPKILLNLPE